MLRNFGEVLKGKLFRSGKYQAQELQQAIQRYYLERVIYLSETLPFLRPKTYQKLRVQFLHLPVYEDHPLPQGILSMILSEKITLVHCWKGSHRTGAVIGLLRKTQGWNPKQTWEEMQCYGFGKPEAHSALFRSVFDEGYSV